MAVTIYLRSIDIHNEKHLALFDSHREGGIDNLVTVAYAGEKVIWKPDCCSGIKRILKIYSKNGEKIIFETDPKKQFLCRGFEMYIPGTVDVGTQEAYTIEYLLYDDTKHILDPYVKIIPPPVKG
jgi:hypothetical protein